MQLHVLVTALLLGITPPYPPLLRQNLARGSIPLHEARLIYVPLDKPWCRHLRWLRPGHNTRVLMPEIVCIICLRPGRTPWQEHTSWRWRYRSLLGSAECTLSRHIHLHAERLGNTLRLCLLVSNYAACSSTCLHDGRENPVHTTPASLFHILSEAVRVDEAPRGLYISVCLTEAHVPEDAHCACCTHRCSVLACHAVDKYTTPRCEHIIHDVCKLTPLISIIPAPCVEEEEAWNSCWQPWSVLFPSKHTHHQGNIILLQETCLLGMDEGAHVHTPARPRVLLHQSRPLRVGLAVSTFALR